MKKFSTYFAALFFLVFFAFSVYGEKVRIDSLHKILKSNSNDTTIVSALVELSELYSVNKIDSLLPLCIKAIEIADKNLEKELKQEVRISFLRSKSLALNNIGYFHRSKGNMDAALDFLHKALRIRKLINDKRGIAETLSNIGYIYNIEGETQTALDYHYRCLKIRQEIADKKGQATSLNRIAGIYGNQAEALIRKNENKLVINDKLKTALDYHLKSLDIRVNLKDKSKIAESLNSIGFIYYNFAVVEKKQNINKFTFNADKASDFFNKSLAICREIGDENGISTILNNLAKLKLTERKLWEAQQLAEKSLHHAQKVGFPESLRNASETLVKIYEAQNNKANAFDAFKVYVAMKDSITNLKVLQKQFQIEFQKKAAEDSVKIILEDKNYISQKLEKEQSFRLWLFIGVLIVSLFAAITYNRYKISIKQYKIISHQREAVEKQRNQIELKNSEILSSIKYAKRIQSTILPSYRKINNLLPNSFILYLPKDIISGDFYFVDTHDTNSNEVYFGAFDCTGHGVPGAMVSVVCFNALARSLKELGFKKPAEILDSTTEIIEENFKKNATDELEVKDGMDASLCCINLNSGTLQWSGAMNPLWIVKNNGTILEFKADKQPVGIIESRKPFTNHTIKLDKGDCIYVFTDGYCDQFGGEKGKKFRRINFKELLVSLKNSPIEEQKKILEDTFNAYKGSLEQVDDVCVFGVKYV